MLQFVSNGAPSVPRLGNLRCNVTRLRARLDLVQLWWPSHFPAPPLPVCVQEPEDDHQTGGCGSADTLTGAIKQLHLRHQ
ncbi:hypothetical protein ACWEGX_01600 [Streptomyces chartreusis]